MEEKKIDVISVIIATYNSEQKLPKVLQSIEEQSYPRKYIEILVVDGGSTDGTIKIAQKYDCRIINNHKTEPVHAKLLGMQNATGKYLVTLDHDEVLENKDSFALRVELLNNNNECKVAFCSGYKRPMNYPLLNQYISEFGDPFSLFMYRYPKDYQFYIPTLKKTANVIDEDEFYMKVSFENLKGTPIIELCCLGTMIDLEYFKLNTNICQNPSELVHLFYIMLELGKYEVVITKNDPLLHYSVDSVKAYFPKLKWRICNNVHFTEKAENGFLGRVKFQNNMKYKKILFIPYSISCVIPLIDSVLLAIQRKNYIYLLHPVFCLYVTAQIIWQFFLKTIGITPSFKSYDGKKKIER